jgi:hypothetical protein
MRAALDALLEFLGPIPGASASHWASRLNSIRARLDTPDAAPTALTELQDCFGGMGSLNDLWIDPRNNNVPSGQDPAALNARLERLLDTVYRESHLVGAGLAARLSWWWLERQRRPGLPPRVLAAFAPRHRGQPNRLLKKSVSRAKGSP